MMNLDITTGRTVTPSEQHPESREKEKQRITESLHPDFRFRANQTSPSQQQLTVCRLTFLIKLKKGSGFCRSPYSKNERNTLARASAKWGHKSNTFLSEASFD